MLIVSAAYGCSLCYCCKVGGLWAFALPSDASLKVGKKGKHQHYWQQGHYLLGSSIIDANQVTIRVVCLSFWVHTSVGAVRTPRKCVITSTYSIKNDSKLFSLSLFVLTPFSHQAVKPDTDISMQLSECVFASVQCSHSPSPTRTGAAVLWVVLAAEMASSTHALDILIYCSLSGHHYSIFYSYTVEYGDCIGSFSFSLYFKDNICCL